MLKKLACTTVLLAALPSALPAATLDYYLKIDFAPGESTNDKHKNEIDVLSWSWGVSKASVRSVTVFAPFSWQQGLDRSFVPLFLSAANGTAFDSAWLSVVRSSGQEAQEFFQMRLDKLQVLSVSSGADANGIVVDGTLSYESITMTYRPRNADGSLGNPISGTWKMSNQAASFAGDPLVMLGMVEAGGTLNFVSGVPEPSSWVTLAVGLGLVGAVLRRRRKPDTPEATASVRAASAC